MNVINCQQTTLVQPFIVVNQPFDQEQFTENKEQCTDEVMMNIINCQQTTLVQPFIVVNQPFDHVLYTQGTR